MSTPVCLRVAFLRLNVTLNTKKGANRVDSAFQNVAFCAAKIEGPKRLHRQIVSNVASQQEQGGRPPGCSTSQKRKLCKGTRGNIYKMNGPPL